MHGRWGLLTRSNLLFVGMIAAAGAITWFGLEAQQLLPHDEEPQAFEPTLTIPAEPELILAPPPPAGRVAEGRLPTRIVIPAAGVDSVVTEVGVVVNDGRPAWETAWRAVGHHLNSARPGQPGNMVLTGHVSVANRDNLPVFANLDEVGEGDIVEVHAGEHVYRYEVTNVRIVPADETRVLRSDHRSLVTLITCTSDLKQRLVVTGQLI